MAGMTALPASPAETRPRAGRPTREQAAARHNELLDAALDHFLEKGYELATIEAIAQHVGMTKRTVYARYPDKGALFRAAVNLAVERYGVTAERIAATETADLHQTLANIARLRIAQVMTPNGLKLQRIIQTESYRFPELSMIAFDRGAKPTVEFLAGYLARQTAVGRLEIAEPERAASIFMSMAVTGPARMLVAGADLPEDDLDDRVRYAVDLFLRGALPRTAQQ